MQLDVIWLEMMQWNRIWWDLMWFYAIWCDLMRCDLMQCNLMRCNLMRCDLMRFDVIDAIGCNTMRFDSMQFNAIWCSLMWFDAIRCVAILCNWYIFRLRFKVIIHKSDYKLVCRPRSKSQESKRGIKGRERPSSLWTSALLLPAWKGLFNCKSLDYKLLSG